MILTNQERRGETGQNKPCLISFLVPSLILPLTNKIRGRNLNSIILSSNADRTMVRLEPKHCFSFTGEGPNYRKGYLLLHVTESKPKSTTLGSVLGKET
jgi:hypothetical protein